MAAAAASGAGAALPPRLGLAGAPTRRTPISSACLTRPAGEYLSRQGVAVSLVDHRLRQAACPPPAVALEQAQAVHAFLLSQQRLRRITSAALVLESTPEALCLDVQHQLRPLLACLRDLGLSQEQTTAVFRALRRQRQRAAQFLALGPAELRRRFTWLTRHLALEGAPAAAYVAAQPTLLLAAPEDAAAVMRWLYGIHWRRLAMRRNLANHPAILLAPCHQLEAAAHQLQCQLDASVDELCLLLSLAPRLLALPPSQLGEALQVHPASWQLAAQHMDRPPMLMQHAAEALHQQVATLYLMRRCSLSRQQVADLARESPTLLRSLKLR